ncbi:MAG: CheR family methyltransferase, partial [Pseudomonadota bacterium]
ASAGGLDAFRTLLSQLKPDMQQAYVLVQHLDPTHESLLPELLSRHSSVPVLSVEDGVRVKPGHVYLIPAGSALELVGNQLQLKAFEAQRGFRRPIDTFFDTVAREQQQFCAGIVLSGTGSDGSAGLLSIKKNMGLVLVQDPSEAQYDGMPNAAISTNVADLVLPIAEMPRVIEEYFSNQSAVDLDLTGNEQLIDRVMKYVRYRTGHDFSRYKKATLHRRLARRLNLLGLTNPSDYLQTLISSSTEAQNLFRDVLINVTEFFRDKSVFETLRYEVIPELVASKASGDDIRVWVPACSTGQEAYSIGMLLLEELARTDAPNKVSIFATDIDNEALAVAREGFFPSTIADEVPAALLQRYFSPSVNGYQTIQRLRDIVRFSEHSVIKDPPFTKLDIVSCRNLLIYFEESLQNATLPIFHYSLRPGGYLVLGPSENIRDMSVFFDEVRDRDRVFRRNTAAAQALALPHFEMFDAGQARRRRTNQTVEDTDVRDLMLERHTPSHVVIDARGTLVHVSKRTGRFLELPEGTLRNDLVALVREPLRPAVRRLLQMDRSGDGPWHVSFDGELDGHRQRLVLTYEELDAGRGLIVFQDRFDPRIDDDNATQGFTPRAESDQYTRELEVNLAAAEQTIRTTVEELETSNEELSTINEELQNKNAQLNELNDDLENLISVTETALVFLDGDLTIRGFTDPSSKFLRLLDHDRGRPLEHIAGDIDTQRLAEAVAETATTGEAQDLEIVSHDGTMVVRVRIRRYRRQTEDFSGVAIALDEVTDLRRAVDELEESRLSAQRQSAEIEELYRVSPQAMALVDKDYRYIRLNEQLAEINGLPLEDHKGKAIADVVPTLGDAVLAPVRHVFETGEALRNLEVIGRTAALPNEDRVWETDWYPVTLEDDVNAVGINVRDVTHHKDLDSELRRVMRELQHRVKNMLANVAALINRARRDDGDSREVLDTLLARVGALANTHNRLTGENWGMTNITDVLSPELIDVYGPDRFMMRGPKMQISAKAALALSMAVHEMATNAAKYGALSNDAGTITVNWERTDRGEGDTLVIAWEERDGPELARTVTTGFGTELINATLEGTLGGDVDFAYEPSGLKCLITIPCARLTHDDSDDELTRPIQDESALS